MGPDHDNVAIGDARIVQVVRQHIGGLKDLAICI